MTDYVGDEQELVDRQELCPLCGNTQPCLHPVGRVTFKAVVLRFRKVPAGESIS